MNAVLLVLLSATALIVVINLVQFWSTTLEQLWSTKNDSTAGNSSFNQDHASQHTWTADNILKFIQQQEIDVAPGAAKEHTQKHEETVDRILLDAAAQAVAANAIAAAIAETKAEFEC